MIRQKVKQMDLPLIICILILIVFGTMMVYSASYVQGDIHFNDSRYFFTRQVIWFGIGILFSLIAALIPYRLYSRLSPVFVLLSILLLVLVLVPGIGVERNNSQRWIQVGTFLFQPTEAVKLCMIIYFAAIYAKKQSYITQFKQGVMPPLLILAVVSLLILQQPDLGSASLLIMACGVIVLCAGVRFPHIGILLGVGITSFSYFSLTSTYRFNRLTSFLNALEDMAGEGYQLVNSYVAIASGGFLGNGLGNSVQKTGFLPEAHTDFIMAIIVEELGFFGLGIVIFSYIFIMFRGVKIAKTMDDMFPKLLAIGLTFQLMLQAIINLGAVSGMLPITGITLPFISYGGSSLVFTMITAGILVNLSSQVPKKV
ncbi:putative lipid II flippase FtsW [Lentibacillus sp. CBA3610]|uniref:putative lipid II flippase FtsW n=1 Tax=Lentibacillus sp. CBA3610 TaxID=2518176 RepID=UPI0015963483|nr:putative lipid II flippase FtsW [Lentibacillus sp. CBA3610]QKY68654.1 putative lipid II flippase FtsW [Lentibacillus sp. CBA3610]